MWKTWWKSSEQEEITLNEEASKGFPEKMEFGLNLGGALGLETLKAKSQKERWGGPEHNDPDSLLQLNKLLSTSKSKIIQNSLMRVGPWGKFKTKEWTQGKMFVSLVYIVITRCCKMHTILSLSFPQLWQFLFPIQYSSDSSSLLKNPNPPPTNKQEKYF